MSFDPHRNQVLLSNTKLSQTNPPLYQLLGNLIDVATQQQIADQVDFGQDFLKAADANGTRINFNKSFSIARVIASTLDSNATISPKESFCTIVAITNTYFVAAAFDDAGTRKDVTINWVAFGTAL